MSPAAKPGKLDPAVVKIASVLIVGVLAAVLDTTIMSIALHTLSVELHASVATIQWVTTGYVLALAATVPLSAWALARFGGKRLWIFALALFMVGSILSSTAWNADTLIAFRVLQGIGAGLMLPVLQTLIMQAAGGKNLGRISAMVGLPAMLGPILGPVAGGLILNFLDWRWIFWVNVPFCIVGLILAWRMLPRDAPTKRAPRLDIVGAVLLIPAIVALLFGLSNSAETNGFARFDVYAPITAGVVLLAAFVLYALRMGDRALVDIRLLRKRSVAASSSLLFLSGLTLYGAMLLFPLYWQQLQGVTVLTAALFLIPQGVGTLLSRTLAGRLSDTIGVRSVAVVGFAIVAVATVPFAFSTASTNNIVLMAALLVRGFGLGAVTMPLMVASFQGLSRTDIPHSSIITRTAQQLGGSFGTAVLAVVLQGALTANVARGQAGAADAYDQTFWWSIGFTVFAVALSFWLPRAPKHGASNTAPTVGVPATTADTDAPQPVPSSASETPTGAPAVRSTAAPTSPTAR